MGQGYAGQDIRVTFKMQTALPQCAYLVIQAAHSMRREWHTMGRQMGGKARAEPGAPGQACCSVTGRGKHPD